MRKRSFGSLGEVSALTLGGGGIGQGWGATTAAESEATLEAAVAAGITLIDVAPSYESPTAPREAERVVGAVFGGSLPPGIRILTKVDVQDTHAKTVRSTIRESLEESLRVMRLERIDLFLHHDYLRPTRIAYHDPTLSLALFRDLVRPEFEALKDEGLIGGWGLTATGYPEAVFEVLDEEPRPAVVQTFANVLDSPGSLWPFEGEVTDSTGTRERAAARGIAVMGIRAVQAGALTDSLDRTPTADDPDLRDFSRAAALRKVAAGRSVPTAVLAYRYALGMAHVDTVVLGVKNRRELADALAAETSPPLTRTEMLELAAAVGRDGSLDL